MHDCARSAKITTSALLADEIIQILGKLAPPPWERDQKLAALAAWSVLEE